MKVHYVAAQAGQEAVVLRLEIPAADCQDEDDVIIERLPLVAWRIEVDAHGNETAAPVLPHPVSDDDGAVVLVSMPGGTWYQMDHGCPWEGFASIEEAVAALLRDWQWARDRDALRLVPSR